MHYTHIDNPVDKCIAKFDLHPSILKIKSNFTPKLFEFRKITISDARRYVLKLDRKKKTSGGIPSAILQDSFPSIAPLITNLINNMLYLI